ncbi:MAG: serine/threonine-protein kinase [Planctomycetota bacterium]|nr:serine/threonine-protein kinase [Planctomycetota bacterium]MDA1249342.1 serine/threonine-protein kinase [Planctomycetota bacterium]
MKSDESPTEDGHPDDPLSEGSTEHAPEGHIPSTIGPWKVIRKIGAGGMGTVYLARHEESDQEAAVKVLSAALAREGGTVERFVREIDTMRRLRSRHIVTFFDSGRDEELDQLYFAMEYVPGDTLADRIRRSKRLPWDQVVDIALQLCAALKSAHVAGIIHRDLKPSNVLIGDDGVVKLTDFGVAQVFASQRLTVTGGIIGTAEYMSPEQAEGRRANKKSDLYSLGALMYVMLTGRPPFTGKTSLDIIRQHLKARFDRPSLYIPDMPRLLEEVVCTLLEKNPDDRYGDSHIVALRLTEVIRRVELAEQAESEQNFAADRMEAPTAAATISPETDTRATGPRGPSPATMMRDVFRAEIEREHRQGPIAKLFDNTWVLLGALILTVTLGVLWFQSAGATTDSAPETESELSSEVDRFWFMSKARRRERDFAGEQRILTSLRDVLGGTADDEGMLKQIDDRLIELRQVRREQAEGYQLARNALNRAESLSQQNKLDEASLIVDGVIDLYGSELGARTLVENARKLARQIAAKAAEAE